MLPFLVVTLALSAAQANEAELLFRQMEKKVIAAKAVQVVFNTKLELGTGEKGGSLKMKLIFAEGNKSRLEFSGDLAGKTIKALAISDGTKAYSEMNGKPNVKNDGLQGATDKFRGSICRCGLLVQFLDPFPGGLNKPFKIDEAFKVSEFSLGPKENIGTQQAQAVRYTLILGESKAPPLSVTVWLDTKTNLPLQRITSAAKDGKKIMTVAETFTELTLNPNLDAAIFTLPAGDAPK